MADARPQRSRIGPWRLLDIVQASMFSRGSFMGGAAGGPEYGPPDVHAPQIDPDELPGSNIAEHERAQAVQRERARRFVRTRRVSERAD